MTQISNEGAFVKALGLNPDTVLSGSVEVKFLQGVPHVQFSQIIQIDNRTLGVAFLASMEQGEQTEDEADGGTEEVTPPTPLKKPVKKTARKTGKANSEEEAGDAAD